MTKNEKAALLAMCLGDGYINKNGTLYIEHSINQLEYLQWKHEFLNRVIPSTKRGNQIFFRDRFDKRTSKIYKQCSCHKSNKYFRLLRKWLYKPQKKFSRVLLNRLTLQGLAIWYMDDGNLNNRGTSMWLTLSTHCSLEEAEIIQNYLREKWNLEFKVKQKQGSYILGAATKTSKEFLDLIRDYILPCMSYKDYFNSARPLNNKGEDIV